MSNPIHARVRVVTNVVCVHDFGVSGTAAASQAVQHAANLIGSLFGEHVSMFIAVDPCVGLDLYQGGAAAREGSVLQEAYYAHD
jgi:hypothetical protein